VAEYVVGALLELAERRSWSLAGKAIGIVGVGNVGSKVLRYATALDMQVLLNDPPLAAATHDPRYVSLDALMEADVLTLHVPLTRDGPCPTYHFFGSPRIRRMKEGAVLVNTSRGAVVETGALSDSLKGRHLGGAVLDVWEGEPGIDIELLEAADLGTSHVSGYSFDGKLNAVRILFDAVARHFGIEAIWHPLRELPPPASPEIVVPESLQGEEIIRFVVRHCYDIRADDRALRTIIGRPPSDREATFRALRAKYGDRREFSSSTVHLPPRSYEIAWVLTTLGFQVK
jgi:erythronate-4-phosphate dehydrogenase